LNLGEGEFLREVEEGGVVKLARPVDRAIYFRVDGKARGGIVGAFRVARLVEVHCIFFVRFFLEFCFSLRLRGRSLPCCTSC